MTVRSISNGMTGSVKKPGFFRKLGRQYQLIIMSVPMLLYVLLFNYAPLWGWLTAFQDYQSKKGFAGSPWVGLDNFKWLFSNGDFLLFRQDYSCSGCLQGHFFRLLSITARGERRISPPRIVTIDY